MPRRGCRACLGAVRSNWVVIASGPQALSGRRLRVLPSCSKVSGGSWAACCLAASCNGSLVIGWSSLVGFHRECQACIRCLIRSAIGMSRYGRCQDSSLALRERNSPRRPLVSPCRIHSAYWRQDSSRLWVWAASSWCCTVCFINSKVRSSLYCSQCCCVSKNCAHVWSPSHWCCTW